MPENELCASQSSQVDVDELERQIVVSPVLAKLIVAGLPVLGLFAALFHGLSAFAALVTSGFLCATVLVCRRALVTFTGEVLSLLVAARGVILIAVGLLLVVSSGASWKCVVAGLLIWLVADRLLGRLALRQLWRDVND